MSQIFASDIKSVSDVNLKQRDKAASFLIFGRHVLFQILRWKNQRLSEFTVRDKNCESLKFGSPIKRMYKESLKN